MNRRELTDGVVSMLATVTTKRVGLCEIPAGIVINDKGELVEPYAIVYPLEGAPVDGSLDDPERAANLAYQVTSVGGRQDHAQWMMDACRGAIVARYPNGDFTNPISAGVNQLVIDRRTTTVGGPEPAGGGLWQVADIFHLEVDSA